MWDKTSPQFGFPAFGLDPFQANQLVELQLRVSQQEQNLNRLQAQRIELDAEGNCQNVRMLREELQQVRGQGSHVGGVAKAMDKEEVFVGVHPDGISVVDDIERCDEEIREPESELSEDVQSEDEQSDEYLSARSELSDSETSERGEPMNDLNDKCSTAETEPSEDKPKKKKSFIFTKAVSALAVGATVTSVALFPATWPVVALNGARVIFATKSIEDNPVTGTIGTVATLALECMIPCASSAKYLVQTGKSIHRVSDLSKVAYGTKLLIQSGKSIHRVGPVARYGWNVASYTSQAITSVVARLKAKSKSKSEKQEKN